MTSPYLVTRGWSVSARLAYYTDRGAPDECWIWRHITTSKGYGLIFDGRMYQTHRVAWAEINGPIPAGLHILHKCDVPACVNPAHLFLGTNADNMRDRGEKGRHLRGERSPTARLTTQQVLAIRDDSRPDRDGAAAYGISRTQYRRIRSRKQWAHL